MLPKRVQPRAGVEGGSARAKGKPRIWAAIVSKVARTRVVERRKNASNKYYSTVVVKKNIVNRMPVKQPMPGGKHPAFSFSLPHS